MVSRGRTARTCKRVAWGIGLTTSCLLVAVSGSYALRWLSPPQITPLTCQQVHEQLPAYVAGLLNRDLSVSISLHLEHCVHCRDLAQELQQTHRRQTLRHTRPGDEEAVLVSASR